FSFFSSRRRHTRFSRDWSSDVCSSDLGQDTYACSAIVDHLAVVAPDVLQRAARYAGLVGRPGSPRWREIQALAARHPQAFGEFEIGRASCRERVYGWEDAETVSNKQER